MFRRKRESVDAVSAARTNGGSRSNRWQRAAAVLGVAVFGLVAAPAVQTAAQADDAKPTIKVALTGDIDSLNPFIAVLLTSTSILNYQYEGLVQTGAENNEIVPGIAASWSTSPDGKVWTYKLPADAKWSDGQPITSKDVAWTYNAIATVPALKQANGSLVENVVSVKAPDDTTAVITLKDAQAPNPGADLAIVPEHIWSKVSDPATFANDKDDVGSGPFVVSSYNKTGGVVLKANQNYRKGAAKIGGIIYVPYKNSDAAVQALKTGEIDIATGLTPAQYQALQNAPGITTNKGSGRRYQALAMYPGAKDAQGKVLGNGNPALEDPILRQAIVRAVDNKVLLEKVLQGLGTLATGEIPMTYPLYHWNATPEELTLSFDPAASNKMLDDAGYKKGADGIRLDKTGKPLSFRLMGRSTDPTHQQMADFIKPWLKDIGINITTEMKSSAQVNDDSTLGNYDLYFTGWGIGADPDFQLSINQCSSRPNADGSGATSESNWCSPEFDALFKAQHTELDQAKRSALVVDAQKLIYHAAANDVLYYADTLEAYRSDRFTGFVTQPAKSGVIMNQNGPWGLYSATPVSASSDSATSSGPSPVIWWVIGGVVVVAGVVILLMRRKGSTADDRE